LLVVVLAVISAGWAIDQLFSRLDSGEADSFTVARSIGQSLANRLDEEKSTEQSSGVADGVGNRVGNRDESIKILQYDELALPPSLQAELESGTSLTLESLDLPHQGKSETRIRLMLTVLFYAAIILLILIWLYPLVRRLQRLAVTAKAFGEGELHQRVPTHPRSRLYDIESEFNNMARRIEGLVSDNKLLSSAVSHDLRTPLARLRFGVDALNESVANDEQADYVERLSADLTMMEQLVSVLLEFAKMDKELLDLPLHETQLHVLVEQAVIVGRDSSEKTIDLLVDIDPAESTVLANQRYAAMMVNNIVQNAIRYGRSKVLVTLGKERNRVCLLVEDDGPGIPESERDNVLKPFVRNVGLETKSATDSSYGLGLAIVSRIAEWHRATLAIENSPRHGGALIRICFQSAPHSTVL